jgi:hypothetical protein
VAASPRRRALRRAAVFNSVVPEGFVEDDPLFPADPDSISASRSFLIALGWPAPDMRGLVRKNELIEETGATQGKAISMVLAFQAIGRGLSESADNWTVMVLNRFGSVRFGSKHYAISIMDRIELVTNCLALTGLRSSVGSFHLEIIQTTEAVL